MAFGMYMVAIPFLCMEFGAEAKELGYLNAIRGLGYGVFCMLVAFVLLERFRHLSLISIGIISMIGLFAVTAVSGTLWHIYVIAILWGVAMSFIWPALFAWMGGTHEDEHLGWATGAVNVSWSAGIMIGSLLGGILYKVAPSMPFAVGAVPLALGYLSLRGARQADDVDGKDREAAIVRMPSAGGVPALVAAWLACFSMSCLSGLMMSVFPRVCKDVGIEVSWFGILVATAGGARTVMFVLGTMRSGIMRDWRFSAATQTAAAVMIATIFRAESYWWFMGVYVTLGLAFAGGYYRSLYASLEGPGSKGFRSAVHESVLFGGILVGSVGGGELAARVDLRAPFVPVAALVVLLNVIQIGLALAARKQERTACSSS